MCIRDSHHCGAHGHLRAGGLLLHGEDGLRRPHSPLDGPLPASATRHGGTDNVWFYDMKADGFSLDDKRSETKENDIPDISERFRHLDKEADRKRTEQSFFVTKQEIADNDYDLSINKYKEVEYGPEIREYPVRAEVLLIFHR